MKRKPNKSELIHDALMNDYNDEQRLMSISEIASYIFREGYLYGGKEVRLILEDQIRRNICHAFELGYRINKPIIQGRKSCKPPNEQNKSRIIGYKILALGDERLVLEELKYKQRNGEAKTRSFEKLRESAEIKGILPEEKLKELELNHA